MRLWNRPDDAAKAEAILRREPGLQRDLGERARTPGFFQWCLDQDYGSDLRPVGQFELLFEALAALERRLAELERRIPKPVPGEPAFRVDV